MDNVEIINIDDYGVDVVESTTILDEHTNISHNSLKDKNLGAQHSIAAIDGLRQELDAIKGPRVIESNEVGTADYYMWADQNPSKENRVGYFVSCDVNGYIKICEEGEIFFGVTVDTAAFIGGQGVNLPRDLRFGLVATNGFVKVRCASDVSVGDNVVVGAGVATKSDSVYGNHVVSVSIDHDAGVRYAKIFLGISQQQVKDIASHIIDVTNNITDVASRVSVLELAVKNYDSVIAEMMKTINDLNDRIDALGNQTENNPNIPEHIHTYSDVWQHDDDDHWQICTECGEISSKSAHSYGDWVFTKNPTENEVGYKTKTCTICGETINEEIPALGTTTVDFVYDLLIDNTYAISAISPHATSIIIPETYNGKSVTKIANNAFLNYINLKNIIIPNSITSIGAGAFDGCDNITDVTLPATAIYAIPKTNLETVVITSGTSIDSSAFADCAALTSITIPDGVKSIGDRAFYNCINIPIIELPLCIENIGESAFEGCEKLTSINIPNGVTSIANSTFYQCTNIEEITIPSSVTTIGNYVFFGCDNLTSIYFSGTEEQWENIDRSMAQIPSSTVVCFNPEVLEFKLLNNGTYEVCSGALHNVSINIPATYNNKAVTQIAEYGFEDCSYIENIVIPDSINKIGNGAFLNCSGLLHINIPKGIKDVGDYVFSGCSSLTNMAIPSGVTVIGNNAFEGCTGLTSITIPNSVVNIGDNAFYDCVNWTNVVIPDGIINIGNEAFSGTGAYNDESNWKDGVFYIGSYLIEANDTISGSCDIKYGTKTIAKWAFSGCNKLTSVTMPDSVTSIGDYAFASCAGFTSVTIGKGVKNIGLSAFHDCNSLEKVYISDIAAWCMIEFADINANPLSKARNLFVNGVYVSDITIPNHVTKIVNYAFYNCTIRSVVIPDSVTSIGQYAFHNTAYYNNADNWQDGVLYIGKCLILVDEASSSAVIKGGTTIIADYAFDGCSNLTSVTIPDGVTSIGRYAFNKCFGMRNIIIPNSVTIIRDDIFNDCDNLNTIYFIGDKQEWNNIDKSRSGIDEDLITIVYQGEIVEPDITPSDILAYKLLDDETYEVYVETENEIAEIDIPATYNGKAVTKIAYNGFSKCINLAKITIPEGVVIIDSLAFKDCINLNSVIIPNSVTKIGDRAFYNCRSLTSITIPSSVSSIGATVFYDCNSLTSVTIPDGITSVGEKMFVNCSSLIDVVIPNTISHIGADAFGGCIRLTKIYFAGTEDEWDAIDKTNSQINNYAAVIFMGEITNGLLYTMLDDNTYEVSVGTATNTEVIVIPATYNEKEVTRIGNDAFETCGNLMYLIIPNSIINIGDWAFRDCSNLTSIVIGSGVESIGERAFYGCNSLERIIVDANNEKYHSNGSCLIETSNKTIILGCNTSVIPTDGSVTSIGNNAFSGCVSLTKVVIPASITSIGDEAFYDCRGLSEFWVDPTNLVYSSIGENLYNKNGTELINYAIAKSATEFNVVDGVNKICKNAFRECTTLEMVNMPNSVTCIEECAFQNCASLKEINLSNCVEEINYATFYGCKKLTSITIPDSVKVIDEEAFYQCFVLSSVTIGNNVGSIEDFAFCDCTSLTSITIPECVKSIGESAFQGCISLQNITIFDTMEEIGASAFDNCNGLKFIYFTGDEDAWNRINQAEIPDGVYIKYHSYIED